MKVTVIGLGPGGGADLTGRARAALEECDLIVGYTAYIDLVKEDFPDKAAGRRWRPPSPVKAWRWCAPATPVCTAWRV